MRASNPASEISQDRQQAGPDAFFKGALQTIPKAIRTADPHRDEIPVVFANDASHGFMGSKLIVNAITRALPSDSRGRLTFRVERVAKKLQIVVTDDGIGLDLTPVPERAFGKNLTDMLVRQPTERLTWRDAEPGTRARSSCPWMRKRLGERTRIE